MHALLLIGIIIGIVWLAVAHRSMRIAVALLLAAAITVAAVATGLDEWKFHQTQQAQPDPHTSILRDRSRQCTELREGQWISVKCKYTP